MSQFDRSQSRERRGRRGRSIVAGLSTIAFAATALVVGAGSEASAEPTRVQSPTPAQVQPPTSAQVQSLTPARLLETRDEPGYETVDGEFEAIGRIGAGETVELVVNGRGNVPEDASAVALNVGAILGSAPGFLTVWPCGTDMPNASNVNYFGADVVSTAVLARVGDDGKVCIYSLSEADVIVDVNGFVPQNGTPVPVVPARVLETRDGAGNTTIDGEFEGEGRVAAGSTVELTVAGRGGVEADAEAVVMNVGAVLPADHGFLTVWPCGTDMPQASNLNYLSTDLAISNAVIAKIGDDGKVCIYTLAETDLIADVNAFVPAGGSPESLVPARLLETREVAGYNTVDGEFEGIGRVAADSTVELTVAGRGGVADDATAVFANVAAVFPSAPGFLTVYPCDEDRPQASNVNYPADDVVSNLVLAKLDGEGKVCIYTLAETDLIFDVMATSSTVIDLQLLAFNDYHGHVTDDTPGDIGEDAAGGGEYLAAKLAELRMTAFGESLTVTAGDLIGGSPFFSGLFHDEPSVESLNAMGVDISGVGNHEFDEGLEELQRMQNGGCHPFDGCYFTDYDPLTPGDQEFGGADFQWLAANFFEIGTENTPLPEYEIREVGPAGEEEEVAFIGMTLEDTDELVAASGIDGYEFRDEVATANALVTEIQTANPGVEAMVLLLHEGGIPNPFAINGCEGISGPIVDINAGLSAEIDVIITGHTHQPYTCMLEDPDGAQRSVTSAYSYGRVVTEINMVIDHVTGEIDRSSVTHVNHPVIQSELTADPAVTAVIDKWTPLVEAEALEPVGTITATISRGGTPESEDRGVESAAGNLVADAQLFATQGAGAQIAFMNPGGVRTDLEFAQSGSEGDGVVTYGEAFAFQPFNNTLYTFPMTGAQIVSVLEDQCQPAGSSRPVLHLGVSEGFTYDLAITQLGGECAAVAVTNVALDGVPIVPTTEYLVTANSFLADGGDNFETFADVDPVARIVGGQDLEALIAYFEAVSPIAPPSTDRVNEI